MKRTLIGISLAALLLVGGATVALAHGGYLGGGPGGTSSILSDVLDDLVTDGTINQSQADAIETAVDNRQTELRTQAEVRRTQMREFLADGTLSADELAQLPEDHPLRNLDQFLEDGQLTQDELRQLGGVGRGFGHHGMRGGPPATDVPSGTTNGSTSS